MLLNKRNLRVMTVKQKVSNPNCSVLGCIRNSYALDPETGEAFCPHLAGGLGPERPALCTGDRFDPGEPSGLVPGSPPA